MPCAEKAGCIQIWDNPRLLARAFSKYRDEKTFLGYAFVR